VDEEVKEVERNSSEEFGTYPTMFCKNFALSSKSERYGLVALLGAKSGDEAFIKISHKTISTHLIKQILSSSTTTRQHEQQQHHASTLRLSLHRANDRSTGL
jgi:hypothetical protein